MPDEDEVLRSALELREKERAKPVVAILDSLDRDQDEVVEGAWAAEVAERLRDLELGNVPTVSLREAMERARAGLRRGP